jgi:hypothetical protein
VCAYRIHRATRAARHVTRPRSSLIRFSYEGTVGARNQRDESRERSARAACADFIFRTRGSGPLLWRPRATHAGRRQCVGAKHRGLAGARRVFSAGRASTDLSRVVFVDRARGNQARGNDRSLPGLPPSERAICAPAIASHSALATPATASRAS